MDTKIRLKNIQLTGYHGVGDYEKKIGQEFQIDIEAYADVENAIITDNINATKDYSALYDKVVNVFSSKVSFTISFILTTALFARSILTPASL